jgi:hypothetical protein
MVRMFIYLMVNKEESKNKISKIKKKFTTYNHGGYGKKKEE